MFSTPLPQPPAHAMPYFACLVLKTDTLPWEWRRHGFPLCLPPPLKTGKCKKQKAEGSFKVPFPSLCLGNMLPIFQSAQSMCVCKGQAGSKAEREKLYIELVPLPFPFTGSNITTAETLPPHTHHTYTHAGTGTTILCRQAAHAGRQGMHTESKARQKYAEKGSEGGQQSCLLNFPPPCELLLRGCCCTPVRMGNESNVQRMNE